MKKNTPFVWTGIVLLVLYVATIQVSSANIFTVSNLTDASANSLRDCINQANATATGLPHEIRFSVSGTITLSSSLPSFSRQIYINGTSAPGYSGPPLVEVTNSSSVNNGFMLNNTASNSSIIEAIVIRGFSGDGILLNGVSSITIRNCRIGTNQGGTASASNGGSGISMINGGSHTITNCVISGNVLNGIYGNNCSNNTITLNKIGCSANGLSRIENKAYGIFLMNGSNNNTIGDASLGNIVSGNKIHGIYIASDPSYPPTLAPSINNKIYGNYIGVDATGNTQLSNGENGVSVLESSGTIIGGSVNGRGNVISGNGFSSSGVGTYNSGITLYQFSQGSMNTTIEGNLIGLGADGTTTIGNSGYGIYSYNCNNIKIGGTNAKISRNYISGNGYGFSFNGPGVHIENGSSINIFNNYIGTDSTGTLARPNKGNGITMNSNASNNRIGGISSDSMNVISGNNENGIYFHNNSYNVVAGNYIGVNKTGLSSIPNQSNGIFGDLTCLHHTIGGMTSSARNIISGNLQNGIFYQSKSHDLSINGNYIGTDKNGSGAIATFGNGWSGIKLDSCERALIGNGSGNVISGNGQLYTGPTSGLNGSAITAIRGSKDAVIQNNVIGLASDGTTVRANKENGIILYLGCDNTLIGGTSSQKNIISGNGFAFTPNPTGQGIVVHESHNVKIYGNNIGTDITGTLSKGNNQSGIIAIWSNSLEIGQAVSGKGNIISNNNELGIHLVGGNTASTSTTIYNNNIGVAADGSTAMGNGCGGIFILGVSDATAGTFGINYTIGGLAALQKNIIANSTGLNTRFGNGYGIGVAGNNLGVQNTFIGNKIYCNKGKGIDLNLTGSKFSSSDPAGNGGKTAPSISASTGTVTNGTGTNGETIHLYYNPSYSPSSDCDCEGEVYLGTSTVAGGVWSITHSNIGTGTLSLSATSTDLSSLTNGTSEFSPCNTVLPVHYLNLQAKRIDARVVSLVWETEKESTNNYFTIERSYDGIHFESIGIINGKGTIDVSSNYSFTDYSAGPDKIYYRLKQTDLDGSFSYSKIITVNSESDKADVLQVYPNPNNGRFIVSYSTREGENYLIELINAVGQIVLSESIPGQESVELNMEYLPSGVYFLILRTERLELTRKIYKN